MAGSYNLNNGTPPNYTDGSYVNNGAVRYRIPTDYYRVNIGVDIPANASYTGSSINGGTFLSWSGGYVNFTSSGFYGNNAPYGPAVEAIYQGSVTQTWAGGVGGYVTWAYNTPGAPSVTTSTRSANGTTLRVIGGGGSGRITYYNVALDTSSSWSANDTTFTVNPSQTYYSRVLAGNEDASIEGTRLVSYGIPTVPSAPIAIKSTTVAGRIDVSWSAPSYIGGGITSYTLYRDGISISTSNVTSFPDTGRTRGVTYSYTVSATNSTGTGGTSSAGTAIAPGVPGAPGLPTVLNKTGRTLTINSAITSLDYGNAITEYRIQVSVDGGSTWKSWNNATNSFLANNTYNILDSSGNFLYQMLTPALTYLWRSYAINSIGDGTPAVIATGVFVGAGGRRFRGAGEVSAGTWQPTTISKRYNGTAWVDLSIAKRYDATTSTWKDLS